MIWAIIGMILAGVGLLCGLWTGFGVLFSRGQGGCLVCICRPDGGELPFVRRMKLLRELELVRCPLILVDQGICEDTRILAERSGLFTICSPEEFLAGLELERNEIG